MAKRVLRATIKTLRFARNNQAETVGYIAKGWNVEPPLAEELYGPVLQAYSTDGGMGEKEIRQMVDREMESGLINQVNSDTRSEVNPWRRVFVQGYLKFFK